VRGGLAASISRLAAMCLVICAVCLPAEASSKAPVSVSFVPSTLSGTGSMDVVLRVQAVMALPGIALEINLPDGVTLEAGERSLVLDAMAAEAVHEFKLRVGVATAAPGEIVASARILYPDSQGVMSGGAVLQINPVPTIDVDERKTLPDGTRIRVREVKSH